jgi:hypothetical protein
VLDERALGAGHIDRDGDEAPGQEALVELPGHASDVERAVLAHATPCANGERGGELGLVDGPRRRADPRVGGWFGSSEAHDEPA